MKEQNEIFKKNNKWIGDRQPSKKSENTMMKMIQDLRIRMEKMQDMF